MSTTLFETLTATSFWGGYLWLFIPFGDDFLIMGIGDGGYWRFGGVMG
jgi:hypothetical protein